MLESQMLPTLHVLEEAKYTGNFHSQLFWNTFLVQKFYSADTIQFTLMRGGHSVRIDILYIFEKQVNTLWRVSSIILRGIHLRM